MNRRQFAHGANVVIDVCKGHGTFFDAGELRKIVDFMKSGGLAKAAAVEQRLQGARQAEAARERVQPRYSSPASPNRSSEYHEVTGVGAVAELILSLFG